MPNKLNVAFRLAESVRYSGDKKTSSQTSDGLETERINRHFAESGLRISEKLTPGIYKALQGVLSHLQIDSNSIIAYVHSSPETQATCFSDSKHGCVIGITSSLVKLMSEEELTFVIGHELGHFLLGHSLEGRWSDESEECLIRRRAQEISVDRMGLVACGSLNIAVQALMKLISGLGEDMLRFDVGSFLEQMRTQNSDTAMYVGENSTHPSLVMRCRALVWFSMSDGYSRVCGGSGGDDLTKIDQRITTDSEKYVDGPARERIAEARENLIMWFAALASTRDGILGKADQEIIRKLVGPKTLNKLIRFYSGYNRNDVIRLTSEKLKDALSYYKKIAPSEAEKKLPTIKRKICIDFNQPDFSNYLSKLI